MLVKQVPMVVGLNLPVRWHKTGQGENLGMDGGGTDGLQALGEAPNQLSHRESVLPCEGPERVHFVGGHFKIQRGGGHRLSVPQGNSVGSRDKPAHLSMSHLQMFGCRARPLLAPVNESAAAAEVGAGFLRVRVLD